MIEDLAADADGASEAQRPALVDGAGAAHPEDAPHNAVPLVPIKLVDGAAALNV
jgi:hypothetical protein